MKKSLWKNNFKEIYKTRRRFISILIMAFLGVGFYAGLTATGPDIQDSLDIYTDESNFFDIDIVSTLGLTDEDLEAIRNVEGIEQVYGIQTKDSISKLEGEENVCTVIEYNENINTPTLISGRLPENSNECLLDSNYSIIEDVSNYIGKTILLENDDTNSDDTPVFTQKELTIVGIVESPLYISSERGNTSIGSGTINFYIYTKDDVINLDYYTEAYATVTGAKELIANSDEYWNLVNPVIEKVEEIKTEREEARYNQLVEDALAELSKAQINLNEENQELQTNVIDTEAVTNQIEKTKWYVRDRKDNTGYTNIIDAMKTLTNIAKIFPVIFYLIAILISLTSMTRMIEEERTEIGTLKALGYTNLQIISKYILYALLACIIGGLLGMTVGFYLLPNIVWTIYSSIYVIPQFYASYKLSIGLKGLVLAFVCIGGATILVATKELKNMPSVLMRPKSPKNGKKIFLEKIPFLWKKFNFSQKVTVRNIFRYKKRAIMTIVGIAGCTGLMVTGFGIKDSVMDIPESQFGEIFKYDISITLSDTTGLPEIEQYMQTDEEVLSYSEIYATTGNLKGKEANYQTTVFVPDSIEDFEKLCTLRDADTQEKIELTDDGVVITNKVAEFLGVNIGDEITFIDSDDTEYNLKIIGITENYVSHYMYMTKTFYEENIKTYKTNMILLDTIDMTTETENAFTESLLTYNGVASVTLLSTMVSSIEDMLGSLNYVVIILIIASAMLAFVVLYNLANINIGERQRELATLKVLGFYDKEVDNYINKENIIFTIIGVILGLFLGYFLTNWIIASVEIDKLRFIRRILPLSYVYSAVITIIFSLTVNYIIHFVLKKIDMIESLKSVE